MADKYELVRQNGLKVFDRETINAHPPLRAAYLTFWNEKCLELLTKKTPKNMVEAIVKREWNLLKKIETLTEMSYSSTQKHNDDGNPFQHYEKSTKNKKMEIETFEQQKAEKEEMLWDGIRKGTLSRVTKDLLKEHIKTLESSREKSLLDLNRITSNWRKAVQKYSQNGPPKGRKRKCNIIAMNIKKSKSEEVSTVSDISRENEHSTDENMNLDSVETILVDENDENTITISVDTVLAGETVDENMNSISVDVVLVEDNHVEVIGTEVDSLNKKDNNRNVPEYFPSIVLEKCQNTVLPANIDHGSNACGGISLLMIKNFLTENITLTNLDSLKEEYSDVMERMVALFHENQLPPMNFKQLKLLPVFKGLDLEEKAELFWLTKLTGQDGYETCLDKYEEFVNKLCRGAFLVTVSPDKTFTILIDEHGNQVLMDSHLHYESVDESFEDALKNGKNGAIIISATKAKAKEFLHYIFNKFCTVSLHADSGHGSMIYLEESKN